MIVIAVEILYMLFRHTKVSNHKTDFSICSIFTILCVIVLFSVIFVLTVLQVIVSLKANMVTDEGNGRNET